MQLGDDVVAAGVRYKGEGTIRVPWDKAVSTEAQVKGFATDYQT